MHNSKLNQCMCSVMKVLRHTQGVLSVWVAYLIKQTLIKNLIITGAQVFEHEPPVLLVALSMLSHVQLFATPWTAVLQSPLSMEFSSQECWNGLPFITPGDLFNPGIELSLLCLLYLQAYFLPPSHLGSSLLAWPCYKDFSAKRKQNTKLDYNLFS